MKLYYLIWTDSIARLIKVNGKKSSWMHDSLIYHTIAMALNLVVLITVFQRNVLKHYYYQLNIDLLPSENINGLLESFILYGLPPLILNYLLIFRNKRYEKLLIKYESSYGGKLSASYVIASLLIYFLYAILQSKIDSYFGSV